MYAHTGKRQRWSTGLGAILLALGAAGCPGSVDPSLWPTSTGSAGAGGSGSGGTGVPACDPTPIFVAKICGNAGCHDANGTAANFDMGSADWQTRLVGVSPKGGGANPSLCGAGGPYLVAGVQPATGMFLDKVKPDTMPACGVLMPQIGPKLSADDFACVQSWANALVMAGPGATLAVGAGGGGARGTPRRAVAAAEQAQVGGGGGGNITDGGRQ